MYIHSIFSGERCVCTHAQIWLQRNGAWSGAYKYASTSEPHRQGRIQRIKQNGNVLAVGHLLSKFDVPRGIRCTAAACELLCVLNLYIAIYTLHVRSVVCGAAV